MKNKVLVAMGIGISAAMVPAVAAVADEIDPASLTEEQLQTLETVNESAEDDVKINDDDDYDDNFVVSSESQAVWDTVEPGSVQEAQEGDAYDPNKVKVAEVTVNNFTKTESQEISDKVIYPSASPSPSPSASPVIDERQPISVDGIMSYTAPDDVPFINITPVFPPAPTIIDSHQDAVGAADVITGAGYTLIGKDGKPVDSVDATAEEIGTVPVPTVDGLTEELAKGYKAYLLSNGFTEDDIKIEDSDDIQKELGDWAEEKGLNLDEDKKDKIVAYLKDELGYVKINIDTIQEKLDKWEEEEGQNIETKAAMEALVARLGYDEETKKGYVKVNVDTIREELAAWSGESGQNITADEIDEIITYLKGLKYEDDFINVSDPITTNVSDTTTTKPADSATTFTITVDGEEIECDLEKVVTNSGTYALNIKSTDLDKYPAVGSVVTIDGKSYIITEYKETKAMVVAGSTISEEKYNSLSEEEKKNYTYLRDETASRFVWITDVTPGHDNKIISEQYVSDVAKNTDISIDDIGKYNVIALSDYVSGGTVNGLVYYGNNEEAEINASSTKAYYETYYQMMLDSIAYFDKTINQNGETEICYGPSVGSGSHGFSRTYSDDRTKVIYVKSSTEVYNLTHSDYHHSDDTKLKFVYVIDPDIKYLNVTGINGVVIAPGANIYLVGQTGDHKDGMNGCVVGLNVYNDGTYAVREEETTTKWVEEGHYEPKLVGTHSEKVGQHKEYLSSRTGSDGYERKNGRIVYYKWVDDYKDVEDYEDEWVDTSHNEEVGTGNFVVNTKEGSTLKLWKGRIDIVGQETTKTTKLYSTKGTPAEYSILAENYTLNGSYTRYNVTADAQNGLYNVTADAQNAIYNVTADAQKQIKGFKVSGSHKLFSYFVQGSKTDSTTTEYYGDLATVTPPVAPPPGDNPTTDDIVDQPLVFIDVTADDDFTPAPVALGAVLGANRPVEVEGTVLGAQRSGSVLGERRPTGEVLGKRRSPKTADAAMGGMIAGMMLSMMTAFGGATVLKKKREDGE